MTDTETVPEPASKTASETAPALTDSVLTSSARASLVRLLRVAYPHPHFPDGPYERTAEEVISQLDESLWHRLALTQGLAFLDAAAGGDFAGLEDEAALELLRGMEDAEFFKFVRSVAVVSLYNNPETWKLLGYEGASFDQGGYLHRGFDDLSWLPAPRVEEYDGPEHLVEVAADDQPAGTGEGDAR